MARGRGTRLAPSSQIVMRRETMMFKLHQTAGVISAWASILFLGQALASADASAQVLSGQARQVENTATASWIADGTASSTRSNEVTFAIAESPARLTTFIAFPNGNDSAPLRQSYCALRSAANAGSTSNTTANAPDFTVQTSLLATQTVRVGQMLVIRIDAEAANRDPASADELELTLRTPAGDLETVTAIEDGTDSGAFFATIDTTGTPPAIVQTNCQLSIRNGDRIAIEARIGTAAQPFLVGEVAGLADPFGIVFDSRDGRPVDGAQVTVIDLRTGQPANVFAFDGVTPFPSTVTSGGRAVDDAGQVYDFAPGEYRFPLLPFGQYRLTVTPPAPYTAPSSATPADLAALRMPDGAAFTISDASYGGSFTIDSLLPIRADIPLDSAGGLVSITKTASRQQAEPGDAVVYAVTLRNTDRGRATTALTLTDTATAALRLRSDTLRVNGEEPGDALLANADGHGFALQIGALAAGETRRITYAMTVREDAAVGDAPNSAIITDADGTSAQAQASVRILRDGLTARMTIIGRVQAGACTPMEEPRRGIPGVRVMLEDGSFAITDFDGRYHFEGVVPGNHVVQVARTTLPEGGEFVDCVDSTRSAGSPISRFVSGQGGSLMRADFHAILPEGTDLAARSSPAREVLDNITSSGANIDFIAMGDGPDGFLFPELDYNPRSPTVRVAIRHRIGHRVELSVNGAPVDALAYDGKTPSADKSFAVSLWRGIGLTGASNRLVAVIRDSKDQIVATHERIVHFANTPLRAELVREQSRLIADGATAPLLAVRMLDRAGRPVHSGISGTLTLDSPYETQSAVDARADRALSGFGNSSATWLVEGDDGIAYIELAPTMVSGSLRAKFTFSDGETSRQQELEAWIEPGDQPWTLIGLAEGSIGARTIAENMERDGNFDSDLGENARVAFYAKGRVLGEYLLTIAYDSAKQEDDQRLLGTIDPAAYYTVFGDNSQRLFDAASRDKLYVRIESSTFYALYGDFETGFDQTQLARYQRIATGVRAEARFGPVQAEAFAAQIGTRQRRDEFQGAGISGPYRLSSRLIVPNSEIVTIEVRDRLRSELIIERRELVRFVDYDIDLLSGTISFAEPVLSRDAAFNPRFVIVNFEVDALGQQKWNAGGRVSWTSEDGQLRIGATGISDRGEQERTDLAAVDLRLRLGSDTEIRAEAALSQNGLGNGEAYIAEVEHHSGPIDLLAYVRQIDQSYGVNQQNLSERGRRKIGADARWQASETVTLVAGAWQEDALDDDAKRQAGEVRISWRNGDTDAHIGLAHISDDLGDGTAASSTILQGGVTQRLFDNQLELTGTSSVPLTDTNNIDLPARHTLGARYNVTQSIRAIASWEVARGDAIDANSLRFGGEITPWDGGTIVTALGQERFAGANLEADSNRTFAAFSLGHSFRVSEQLVLDATLDTNQTLGGGIAASDVINPDRPVSSGGQLGNGSGPIGSGGGSLGEDFTAVTLGASWSADLWNARLRGEYRDGEFADRKGVDVAAIRSLGNGSVIGSGVTWTRATAQTGGTTEILDASISLAHRPAESEVSALAKVEYRSDAVTGATGGQVGAAGQTALLVDGDAKLRRLLGSLSTNWSLTDDDTEESRSEVSAFVGVRHSFDRVEQLDIGGTSLLGGLDVRYGITERIDIGGRASARHDLETGTTSFAVGPEIGFVPADNVLLSVGYNITGFRDPDFNEARFTDKGLFATVRVKLDDDTFGALGIGR